ncbi:hypothetical protein ACJ72_08354, partial [Emergomyces africanus]
MSLSPPPAPLSLPFSSHSHQPSKKRPSVSGSVTSHKKPRMHPLRQTSFPASQDTDPRVYSASATSVHSEADGRSATGSFTGSVGGGSADGMIGSAKGKRRKKGVGGVVGDGGPEGLGNEEGYVEEGEEEGDEGDLEEGGDEEGERDRDGAAREAEAERKNLAILIDAFTPAQSSRYDFFKRAKLNKPMVRKIVNQTLSQSVPPNVITTISGYTKVFVGELVEKARTVQEEWAEAADRDAYAEYVAALAKEEEEEEEARVKSEAETATATAASTQSTQPTTTATNTVSDTQTRTFESNSSTAETGPASMIKTEPKESGMAAVKEEPSSSANDIKENDATVPPSTTTN